MFFTSRNFFFALIATMLATSAHAQSDPCWIQHRATVFEWTCAGQSLPAQGQEFALSIAVIDSPKALMVIDSGATASVGESAAAAVRSKFGTKPMWILNSQAKAEHVLGNVGFQASLASAGESIANRFVAGKRTAELMRARCPVCIENFAQRLGGAALAGTESLIPGRILRTRTGHLGMLQGDWVPWKFRLYENLETAESLVLRNQELKLWWVGSAVQNRDIPDLYEGDVIERIDFLKRLRTNMALDDTVLTSYGALGPDWIERNLNYFVSIHQDILYGLESGLSEVELIQQISAKISEFQNPVYVQTDPAVNAKALEVHQLNIQRIYRQTEPFAF